MADPVPVPAADLLGRLRREVALVVDREGVVRWGDDAAYRLLSIAPGQPVERAATPGTEAKLAGLVASACEAPVEGWEVSLLVEGRPATLSVRAVPAAPGALLVASLVPDDFGRMLATVNGAMAELGSLHRQSERQQRELQQRNHDLVRLNRELDESSRGVMALHGEVARQSQSMRQIVGIKSRVVANISHEFRTPLNAIVGLSKILLGGTDGDLTAEQQKQVGYILRAAQSLGELVDDMLDLSKIDAGKVPFRPSTFTLDDTFSALRGMFRPLQTNPEVALVFEDAPPGLELETDEGKLSQVLRNLVGNALKFTERGEIRVRAEIGPDDHVRLQVRDTGIGIPEADHERVFEEFEQMAHPLQERVKGTGLGLPLSRRLAVLLGGTLTLESRAGEGATFTLTVPRVHPEVSELHELEVSGERLEPGRAPILVVEDDRRTLFLYEQYLRGSGFQIVPARTIEDARRSLERVRPAAIVLDVMLEGETTWSFLAQIKSDPRTRDIPVLVVTVVNREQRARALGADEFFVKPLEREWVLKRLDALVRPSPQRQRVLVVDDDEVARYMLRKLLADTRYDVIEAKDGPQALALAREHRPQVIFLDFVMPGMNAFDVMDELKGDAATRDIPIVIHTSRTLADDERRRLEEEAASILPKQSLTREVAIGRIRDALLKAGLGPGGRDDAHG